MFNPKNYPAIFFSSVGSLLVCVASLALLRGSVPADLRWACAIVLLVGIDALVFAWYRLRTPKHHPASDVLDVIDESTAESWILH